MCVNLNLVRPDAPVQCNNYAYRNEKLLLGSNAKIEKCRQNKSAHDSVHKYVNLNLVWTDACVRCWDNYAYKNTKLLLGTNEKLEICR